MKGRNFIAIKTQSGVVLLVSLIMLLLLTLIGITGSQVTGQEEKMAGNMRDKNLAFQAAESALSEAEAKVTQLAFNCTNGRFKPMDKNCDNTLETVPVWEAVDWTTTGTVSTADNAVPYSKGNLDLSSTPAYIIETLPGTSCAVATSPCPAGQSRYNYRITARATGGSSTAVVMIQSVFQTSSPPP